MEKLTYTEQNGFLVPDLTMDEMPEQTQLGRFGAMREKYLMEHRKGLYSSMLMTGKLWTHLTEIDRQAVEMLDRVTEQQAQTMGVTEKAESGKPRWAWVQQMNNIRHSAEESVLSDLIYALTEIDTPFSTPADYGQVSLFRTPEEQIEQICRQRRGTGPCAFCCPSDGFHHGPHLSGGRK